MYEYKYTYIDVTTRCVNSTRVCVCVLAYACDRVRALTMR
jgi:hypothetical protein